MARVPRRREYLVLNTINRMIAQREDFNQTTVQLDYPVYETIMDMLDILEADEVVVVIKTGD